MANNEYRKQPTGIQAFNIIREEGYLYVDKTDIIWDLANKGRRYNYLSRPRRFGKSVLIDTLQCYFEGRKEFFEGLKIMDLEKDWKEYPVIRLDMSRGGANAETLRSYLNLRFGYYEEKYVITPDPTAQLADRFDAIITTAYKQTGLKVAILIDEYDSPQHIGDFRCYWRRSRTLLISIRLSHHQIVRRKCLSLRLPKRRGKTGALRMRTACIDHATRG